MQPTMDQRKKISERDIRTKEREISEYLKVHCVPEDYAAVKLQQFVALQTRFECANTLEVMARMMHKQRRHKHRLEACSRLSLS